ncbi:hypothetical protein [Hyphococcus sp.]|jgi:hypothetical protein|uniref:hypothetical protein n=1 Tax=Hyphococcus sp. TaxID=2038636 RepID=UPI003D0C704E
MMKTIPAKAVEQKRPNGATFCCSPVKTPMKSIETTAKSGLFHGRAAGGACLPQQSRQSGADESGIRIAASF